MKRLLFKAAPFVFVALALLAAAYAVSKHASELDDIFGRLAIVSIAGSILLGMAGVFLTLLMWCELLRGLGAPVPTGEASKVFFVSQLGKYLPGSVWPVVAQMEYGRRTGIGRRTMLTANALTLALSLVAGLILAAIVLPFSSSHALADYWWALACLPVLLIALHPRVVPGVLDWLFRRLGRESIDQRLSAASLFRAVGWAFASWLLLGLHLLVLVQAVGVHGSHAVAAAIGGFSLAACAGVLFIPAPAGAGIRDAVLIAALGASMGSTTALALGLASRVLLIVVDLLVALLATISQPLLKRSQLTPVRSDSNSD